MIPFILTKVRDKSLGYAFEIDNVDLADLILRPEERGDARRKLESEMDLTAYAERQKAGFPTRLECVQCEHPCKVNSPHDGAQLTLICRKTRPEMFS